MPWHYNPHSGGKPVPPAVQERTRARILAHAERHHAGQYDRINVRFRGAFCYIDAFLDGNDFPTHLVRLRFNGDEERWTVAFFTYSREQYEPTFFRDGKDHGTPEAAFEIGAGYLIR